MRLVVSWLWVSLAISVREMLVDALDFISLSYAMVVNTMCMGRLWKFAIEARIKNIFPARKSD